MFQTGNGEHLEIMGLALVRTDYWMGVICCHESSEKQEVTVYEKHFGNPHGG